MMGKREESAQRQSDFYREKYYGVLRALLMSVCVIVLLIGIILYLVLFAAAPRYYATTEGGMILPMQQVKSSS